ncbi:MAG TPA: hotdog fold thioesterase [Bacteroidetes bacterium]|nr:hotdog fold thioesterase [Bacteroidota bacterium]
MAIWFKAYEIAQLQSGNYVNMLAHLDIQLEEIGDDFLAASMPVDKRTQQPFGILHGGATCVLAESLGSIAANLVLDLDKQYAVGLEINANHLRSVREGRVQAITRPVHLGRSTQVWEIRVQDEKGKLSAISRLTMAVLDR